LVCDRANLLSIRQMIFFFGMVIGCLTTGTLSDKFGRKRTMLGLMGLWSVSSLLHTAVPSGYFSLFLILQFALALAAQSSFTISWIWTVEILGNGKWRTSRLSNIQK
jgi:OCT family organic cation transporter-like MFS transporter 4/5